MSKKRSRCLVIDASIARSAGGEDAVVPRAIQCRDFLLAVRRICHQVVMTPEIKEEWDRHRSRFASTWLTSMFARKKVYHPTDVVQPVIRQKIAHCPASDNDRAAMLKDLRLIEAAIGADRIVISLDDRVRGLFMVASEFIGEIRTVVWVNPENTAEEPITWLEHGAEAEKHRLLGVNTVKDH